MLRALGITMPHQLLLIKPSLDARAITLSTPGHFGLISRGTAYLFGMQAWEGSHAGTPGSAQTPPSLRAP